MARSPFDLRSALLVLSLTAGAGGWSPARSAESADSILSRLNEAASHYLRALARVRGEAETETRTGPKSDPKIILGHTTFHRSDGRTSVRRVLRLQKDPSVSREVVFASDGEGQFVIERLDETRPFELKTFRRIQGADRPGFDDFYPTLNRFLLAPVTLSSFVSTEIVKNPHFKLGRAEKMASPEETYRVHYELNDPALIYGSGWFEVSPRTGWLISKSSCRYGNLTSRNRATTTVEYGLEHAGQSVPRRVHIFQGSDQSSHINDDDFRLESIAEDDSVPADFRTASYGLPDPGRLMTRGGRLSTATLLLVLAPVALMAAIAMKVLAHRRSRRLDPA